jgi:hypothetical protein
MEECTARVVHSLQEQEVKMIALTSRSPSVANVSIRQLTSLGINLSMTAPSKAYFSLINVPETLYRQGILFTNGNSKRAALSAFLHQLSWIPRKIVFVDDRRKYLEEVCVCEDEGIEFIGLRFNGSDVHANAFDPKVCDIELQSFLNLMLDDVASELAKKS